MSRVGAGDGTVGKALEVLDLVAGFGRPVRFSELQSLSTLPKATLYRHIQALTNQGMLSLDPERNTYTLGARLVRLAHVAWRDFSLAPIARPHLERLSRDLGETVHLAQLDGGQVLYVDKVNASMPVEMYSSAGKVGPAYCTGVGKVMLAWCSEPELARLIEQQSFHAFTPATLTSAAALRAELQAIRQRGYAFDNEEHETGIICVALPVLTESGRVQAGLSVTSTTQRRTVSDLAALVPRIRQTAEAISEAAQDWRFPDEPQQNRQKGTGS